MTEKIKVKEGKNKKRETIKTGERSVGDKDAEWEGGRERKETEKKGVKIWKSGNVKRITPGLPLDGVTQVSLRGRDAKSQQK